MAKQESPASASEAKAGRNRPWIIGLTSFFFILLQSACTAVMALSGLRLIIGVGSLAFAASGVKLLASIHGDAIRIPMEILAVGGSALNPLRRLAHSVAASTALIEMESRTYNA